MLSEIKNTTKTTFIKDGFLAIVENADGEKYLLTADSLNDVLEDWKGDCNFVPANDARVYFAMFNEKPVNPYDCDTFERLLGYLQGYYRLV